MSITFAQNVDKKEIAKRVLQTVRLMSDFPRPGISFIDIMPIFKQPALFSDICAAFIDHIKAEHSDATVIAGLESRGLLFGPLIAVALNLPFVPFRKAGKLPGAVERIDYKLEYGSATIECQVDAFSAGDKIIVFDDLIATGGTLLASVELARRFKASVVECCVVIAITSLPGRASLEKLNVPLFSLAEAAE